MALGARKGRCCCCAARSTALVSIGTVLGLLGAFALAKLLSALTNVLVDALKVGTDDLHLLVGAPYYWRDWRWLPVMYQRHGSQNRSTTGTTRGVEHQVGPSIMPPRFD